MNTADHIQLVWFSAGNSNPRAAVVYAALFGDEPDATQNIRNVNPTDPILSTASGPLKKLTAEIQIRPSRIDLFIRNPVSQPDDSDPPTLDLRQTIPLLSRIFSKASTSIEKVIRVSMVTRLMERAANSSQATSIILDRLGVKIDAPNLSEPVFSINSQTSLKSGTTINRIMRYEMITLQTFALNPQSALQAAYPIIREQTYVSLQLDLNTAVSEKTMSSDEQTSVFSEIASETLRLAQEASPRGLRQ